MSKIELTPKQYASLKKSCINLGIDTNCCPDGKFGEYMEKMEGLNRYFPEELSDLEEAITDIRVAVFEGNFGSVVDSISRLSAALKVVVEDVQDMQGYARNAIAAFNAQVECGRFKPYYSDEQITAIVRENHVDNCPVDLECKDGQIALVFCQGEHEGKNSPVFKIIGTYDDDDNFVDA